MTMKKPTLLLAAAMLALFSGCSPGEHKDGHHNEEGEHVGTPALVQLDNGKKWLANIETTQGMQSMAQMVDTALSNPDATAVSIKENLLSGFTEILDKCTMTGEPHEQLHHYLVPLKEDIERLDEGNKEEVLADIKAYLDTYKNYFE